MRLITASPVSILIVDNEKIENTELDNLSFKSFKAYHLIRATIVWKKYGDFRNIVMQKYRLIDLFQTKILPQ